MQLTLRLLPRRRRVTAAQLDELAFELCDLEGRYYWDNADEHYQWCLRQQAELSARILGLRTPADYLKES